MSKDWAGLSCSVCPPTPTPPELICFLSFTLSLAPTPGLFPLTLFVFAIFSCSASARPLLYTPPPPSPPTLKPTPWQPVAASPRKVDSLSVVPSNPMQHQTVRHATLLTRNSQERLLRTGSWTGGRERCSKRKTTKGVVVPNWGLLQCNFHRGKNTSNLDLTFMIIRISTE